MVGAELPFNTEKSIVLNWGHYDRLYYWPSDDSSSSPLTKMKKCAGKTKSKSEEDLEVLQINRRLQISKLQEDGRVGGKYFLAKW